MQAYLTVGPGVAQYAEHRQALVGHLLRVKLRHWEQPVRELAAKALGALVPCDPPTFQAPALQELLPLATHSSLEARAFATRTCGCCSPPAARQQLQRGNLPARSVCRPGHGASRFAGPASCCVMRRGSGGDLHASAGQARSPAGPG